MARNKLIKIEGEVALIPLTQGYFAKIDAADIPLMAGPGWQLQRNPNGNLYAQRKQLIEGLRRSVYLHRLILKPGPGMIADHRNGDGLDCRRSNLRECLPAENMQNLPVHRAGRKVGVHYDARRKRFDAKLALGSFDREEDAVRAIECARAILAAAKQKAA